MDPVASSWEILGIAETADKTAIKRAYIALVKKHNPQTDIEGFKRVRTAYEDALAEADYVGMDVDQDEPPADSERVEETVDNDHAPDDDEFKLLSLPHGADGDFVLLGFEGDPSSAALHNDVTTLMDDMSEILETATRRRNAGEWQALFERSVMAETELRAAIGAALFSQINQLAEKNRSTARSLAQMPPNVWLLFDRAFGWSAAEIDLARSYPPKWVDFVMTPILKAQGKAAKPSYARSMRRSSPGSRKQSLGEIIVWIAGIATMVAIATLARKFVPMLF